jgi:fatty acid desaturase
MEHHFMAGVPCYRLPELRRLLESKGYLDGVGVTTGYGQVLAMALGRQAVAPA